MLTMNFVRDVIAGMGAFFFLLFAAAFIFWQVQRHKK